jgi:hypothetical protein
MRGEVPDSNWPLQDAARLNFLRNRRRSPTNRTGRQFATIADLINCEKWEFEEAILSSESGYFVGWKEVVKREREYEGKIKWKKCEMLKI